ncbi:MAG: phenylalanine--tRNA ligase subunit alpha [Nitrospinaceae bacterium]|nr:phenylalanine--tRNA ligase subunit alpha [Nitrospinaceae bacterium]NIR56793.1 phenylalanine--tRNA ligase subunit alpha [Nitrospinaceae bacterium]NIS87249.1 phenylalanine--tRNA ligase subunit alpha [Nitrospinaceae bacterium]NIT82403.1 phenylalanine--tRNA ligase subunit alpha [Nitrospinaceae bacterium]NIU44616.1 phenylalanine--tRNA ligase subunit alpha [Nitrospinaceae bacterium]
MIDEIKKFEKEFEERLSGIALPGQLQQLRTDFLGKKGYVTGVMKGMRELSPEEKREVGRHINEFKNRVETQIREKTEALKSRASGKGSGTEFDITLPGRKDTPGTLHPITQVMDEIISIFVSLGFAVAEGPEVESDYYNFEALNIPKDHPARDMQDTFYIGGEKVLRTHTSPVQIHVMEKQPPPLRIIAPGKVYRCDSDISHTPMFHQIEGLMVDQQVSFSDLKGVMNIFLHQVFGEKTQVRFRPSFFPFTCPSAEVDIQCVMCSGKGCRVCSQTGWLEILGAGMVDPAVFGFVDYDPEKWTGFAFGLGIERIAMLKYGIHDIRLFFENDQRFLSQF